MTCTTAPQIPVCLDGIDIAGTFRYHIWYDGPLMFSMGTAERPFIGFASSRPDDRHLDYFVIPFSLDGVKSYMDGKTTARDAAVQAGGVVYYTSDFLTFRSVRIDDIPDYDLPEIDSSGVDRLSVMESVPEFS